MYYIIYILYHMISTYVSISLTVRFYMHLKCIQNNIEPLVNCPGIKMFEDDKEVFNSTNNVTKNNSLLVTDIRRV